MSLALGGGDDGYRAASDYARAAGSDATVFEVALDVTDLEVEDLEIDRRACWDANEWPCDRAEELAAYVARGVDAIRFTDATERGREHVTIRLLSERALAALTEAGGFEPA